MSILLDVVSWLALIAGGLFCLTGALGLHRMPDVFTRMHATSVIDTLGVGFLTLGMLLQTDDWTVIIRLIIIVIVLYTTGAVASHALARAALHDGQRPVLAADDGSLAEVDCADVAPDLALRVATPLLSENAGPERTDPTEGAPSKS